MQAQYRTKNGQLTFNLEGEQKEIFKQVAQVQEVFEEESCGCCGKSDLRYVIRVVDDNHFYELHCKDCRAKLAFGVNKKGGTIFPKKKMKDGKPSEDKDAKYDSQNRGWHKYSPQAK